MIFNSYLNKNFIDWSKISDFSKVSFENLKDNEKDNGMNGNDIHITECDDILVVDKNFYLWHIVNKWALYFADFIYISLLYSFISF